MIKAMGLAYAVLAAMFFGTKMYLLSAYNCAVVDGPAIYTCVAAENRAMWIVNGVWIALVIVIMLVARHAARNRDQL